MNEDIRALIPSKGLIVGAILVIAVIAWFIVSPGEKRSSNPFDKNYDPSLNNSGPKLKHRYKLEVTTETTDANGVTHQSVH